MLIVLFVIWLLLNGIFALSAAAVEMYIVGAFICGAIAIFVVRCMDYRPSNDLYLLRNAGLFLVCLGILLRDVVLANIAVLKIITRKETAISPVIIQAKVPLKRQLSRVMLANYITLTPGTITIEQNGDDYTIHCLDQSMVSDLDQCPFVKTLRRMESND